MLKPLPIFKLFGLPSKFNIDTNSLKLNYYSLSKTFHPDRNKDEKNFHKITTGYNILKNDLKRAEYLVNLKNQKIKHNNEFFNYIMELEERCNEENKNKIQEEINENINECKNNINPINVSKWKYFKRIIDSLIN